MSGVAAFGLAPGTTLPTTSRRGRSGAICPTGGVRRARATPARPGYWREERIRRGDTIGSVLARLGVDDPEALEFLRTDPAARALYQLRPASR